MTTTRRWFFLLFLLALLGTLLHTCTPAREYGHEGHLTTSPTTAPIHTPTQTPTTEAPATAPVSTPACEYEDASGPNDSLCRWDAGTEGNGIGESFTAHRYGPMIVMLYDNGDCIYADTSLDDPEPLSCGDGWTPPSAH